MKVMSDKKIDAILGALYYEDTIADVINLCELILDTAGASVVVAASDEAIAWSGIELDWDFPAVTISLPNALEEGTSYRNTGDDGSFMCQGGAFNRRILAASPIVVDGELFGGMYILANRNDPAPASDAIFEIAQTSAALLGRCLEG